MTTSVPPGRSTSSSSNARSASPSQGGATANSATAAAEVTNVYTVPKDEGNRIFGIEHVPQEETARDSEKDRKTDRKHEFMDILMDSGSTIHVCPKCFVKSEDITEPKRIEMTMADGQQLTHYGSKEVCM